MENRPDKVRIGAFDYKVIWEGLEFNRSANAVAQIDFSLFIIRIYKDAPPCAIACRFLHEVIHGIIWFQEQSCDGKINEEDCCNIGSYGIVDFWRSNPEVFKWWNELITTGY